jgi:uncharacterized protein (DUF305 family)
VLVVAAVVAGYLAGHLTARAPAPDAAPPSAVDVGFSQDMGTHHDQAVLMAGLAASRAGPAVRVIANAILVSQSQELGSLRGWLGLWRMPAQSAAPMAWMSGAGGGMPMPAGGRMPGMASSEELTGLWAKTGADFDVDFLRLMIRHHQGGVTMAGFAATHGGLTVVREAAATMRFQQTEDIAQMQALLGTYGAAPLPTP